VIDRGLQPPVICEFSLTSDHWVPDEVKERFRQSESFDSVIASLDSSGPVKYRDEFDLGPRRPRTY
jgi:hypothetical protein